MAIITELGLEANEVIDCRQLPALHQLPGVYSWVFQTARGPYCALGQTMRGALKLAKPVTRAVEVTDEEWEVLADFRLKRKIEREAD